jgi:sugar lactone lactonase YvrE
LKAGFSFLMITAPLSIHFRARSLSCATALFFLTGCAASTPDLILTLPPSTTPPRAPTAEPTSTFAPAPTASPNPTPTTQPSNYPITTPRIEVIAENLGYPDFFTRASDGSFYISDYKAGTIQRFKNGKTELVISHLGFPECVMALPDDSLAILENGKERLIRYDLNTKQISLIVAFTNRTGLQGGVDDFAFDSQTKTFVVPDTPNGVVLRISLDGRTVKEIARGFKQPTSAYVERDGGILISDKGAGTIKRIRPDGKVELIIALPVSPDGAISDEAGNIFFVTLQDSAVHLLRAGASKDEVYAKDLKKPAAPMWDVDGNLLIAESGAGRLIRMVIK